MVQLLVPGRKTAAFPVAVKGVVPHAGRVLLLKTRSGRWDLPGGKILSDETVERCLVREAREEAGLAIEPVRLIDCWVRERTDKLHTLVLVYLCAEVAAMNPTLGDEHKEWQLVAPAALAGIDLAARYRASVQEAMGLAARAPRLAVAAARPRGR
jgi:diadenosine hexaphosphate hydrolase (ATP-forming)